MGVGAAELCLLGTQSSSLQGPVEPVASLPHISVAGAFHVSAAPDTAVNASRAVVLPSGATLALLQESLWPVCCELHRCSPSL